MITISKKLLPSWFDIEGSVTAPGFLLAPLSSAARLDAQNELSKRVDGSWVISGRGAVNTSRECIRDWRGVFNESGEPIPFSAELVAELPPNVLRDISVEALSRANLSETERKNS